MKSNRYLVISIIVVVFIGIFFIISYTQKGQVKDCREGFTKIDNGCTTEKTNFECTDKILSGKGYSICDKFITNIGSITNYRDIIENNLTLKIKGKIWSSYQFCPTDPNAPMPMTCDMPWNNIEVTTFETVE
jgi:hypothetical protein